MTFKQSFHVDRNRRDIVCDEPECKRSQLLPVATSDWDAFLEKIGWRADRRVSAAARVATTSDGAVIRFEQGSDLKLSDMCPFCAGSVSEPVCDCPQKWRGPMMFEVRRVSETDTRFICKHCNRWIGIHDANPPRTKGMR